MVGLRYSIGELARPLGDIRGVVLTLATNFVLVPLLAMLLLRLIPLEAPHATGMIVVASAAGAPLLVKLAMNAKADVAFAASLIVLLLFGTIIGMPILVPLLADAGRVSTWAIAQPLLLSMFLPLAIGFFLRPRLPELAQRAAPILARIVSISLWVMVGLSLFLNRGAVIGVIGTGAIIVSVLFIALAYCLGHGVGYLDKREQVVLGFGAAQRNFAAAIVVANTAFGKEPGVLVMAVVMSVVAMLLLPFSSWLGRRKAGA